ncbi:hypothetical protein OG723_39295 [Streptomyces sp. NBC_01278]|nr:hypothetical protein [Streptomyces sp. NBC_01278]
MRVWVDGGIDTADVAQRQALDGNVAYSLRMLSAPSPPTDTPHVSDH